MNTFNKMNNNIGNFNNMNNNMNNNNMINNIDIFNNTNNNMNNFNNNQNIFMNNMNNQFNMLSNNLNNNNNNQNQKRAPITGKIIFIIFTLQKVGKQIFIDSNENEKFFTVIKDLEEKYEWLKTMKRKYYFNNKEITEDKSLKDLGIKDNSDIIIKI